MNTAGAPCVRCDRSVYAAEGITLDGRFWHKGCFACEECRNKLTLQTYFVSHGLHGHIFCKKCGPVLLPTLDAEGVEFRRVRDAKGRGARFNEQIRGDRRLNFRSFRKKSNSSLDGDDDAPPGGGGDAVEPPEIDVAGPVTHSGEESSGYHESGYPIYGNLPGYYANDATGRDGVAASAAAAPPRSKSGVTYSTVMVGGAGAASAPAPAAAPPAARAAPPTTTAGALPMAFSFEGTYDNPKVAAAAFQAAGGEFLPGSAYEMSDTVAEAPKSPRSVSSEQYNKDVRSGRVDPMQATAASLASLDLSPHPAALEDVDYGQPCMTCKTCPGFMLHRWRKVCQMCRCSRINHRSREITDRRRDEGVRRTGKAAYSWTPAGCDLKLVEAYFEAIPQEYVPRVGTEGELWRREQQLLQLPVYDTEPERSAVQNPNHAAALQRLDGARLREAFDVGDVVACPDFARPEECAECNLRDDGTHWPYCSNYIDPDLEKRTIGKKAGTRKGKGHAAGDGGGAIATQLYPEEAAKMRSIKSMKRGGDKDSAGPAVAAVAPRRPSLTLGGDSGGGGTNTEALIESGKNCHACLRALYIGYPVVSSGRFGEEEVYFHPTCFSCSECGELLVDLRAFVGIGKEERGEADAPLRLFCGRHWCDNMYPRCAACDEIIFTPEYVHELGKSYHVEHFCCTICDANLAQLETYVPRGRKPYCFPCFGVHFAEKCTACAKPINPAPGFGGKVTINTKHWHGGCYKCNSCGTGLAGKPCIPRNDLLWCKPCLKKQMAAQKKSGRRPSASTARRPSTGNRTLTRKPQPPPRPTITDDGDDSDGVEV